MMVSTDLFILSAPSGAGKSSIIRALLERDENMAFSVSHTTRPPRSNEQDGKDYYFIDEQTFSSMRSKHEFVEWASVHDAYYGTAKMELQRLRRLGKTIILDIDVQGTRKIQAACPEAVYVMILPPSWSVLKERLKRRGDLAEDQQQLRLQQARKELSAWWLYDYLVVNDDFYEAVARIHAIIESRASLAHRMEKYVSTLL